MLWVRIPLREGVLDTTLSDQGTNKKNGTDYNKKCFGYKWTPATTIHNYTNSNNGKSLFIDVLHFSHHRDFKNEHNSYPKMSVKQTLDSLCRGWIVVLFTFADECYIWSSLSFLCHLMYIILFPICFKIIYSSSNLTNTVIIYLLCF
jgi:hypothetical protein